MLLLFAREAGRSFLEGGQGMEGGGNVRARALVQETGRD